MKSKSKVLVLGPVSPPMGGIATYVEDMLKSSINNEYNLLHINTARNHSIKKSFVKNILLFSKNTFKLIYSLSLNKPKIVHIHTSSYAAFWEKSIFVGISKAFKKNVLLHIHGAEFNKFYENSNVIGKYFIRFVLNASDKVIVLSMFWKEFFLQIINDDKISVIQNGINSSKYDHARIHVENKKATEINVLFLGNLVQRKGIYDILKSIPIVVNKFENAHFIFSGSEEQPGEIDKLKKECINQGIGKYVTFKSNFSDSEKIKLLAESDIYILPSYAEGLPISLLEAMAAGLPIISTHVGGIPEVITEEDNGYLIYPGDYLELANRIIQLIDNPKIRITMSEINKKKIRNKYDWKVVANKISNEYNQLLEY